MKGEDENKIPGILFYCVPTYTYSSVVRLFRFFFFIFKNEYFLLEKKKNVYLIAVIKVYFGAANKVDGRTKNKEE